MKTFTISAVSAVALAFAAGAAAAQEQVSISIDETATYEVALACYQFHGIEEQIAGALQTREGVSPDDARQHAMEGQLATALKTSWNQQIDKVRGEKSNDEINADLVEISGDMVQTANAALGGDAEAAQEFTAQKSACGQYERIQTG